MSKNYIPLCEPVIGDLEKERVNECLDSGFVSSAGPLIREFEEKFADFTGAEHAVATASGTAAIHTALAAAGIGKEDSVVVQDLTFVASMNPVLYCGAEPVLADIDSGSWGLDPRVFEDICESMSAAGKPPAAVIPVHLYGCTCRMREIKEIAGRYGVRVIEDATEALGSSNMGVHTGRVGDAGCFSFNGNKMMTTGSGGMVITDDRKLADKMRMLVAQGRGESDRYIHSCQGYNYRMTNLSAALGLAQLERLEWITGQKEAIAARYIEAFNGTSAIECNPESDDGKNIHWLFSILLPDEQSRDTVLQELNNENIAARRFFEPLHQQPYIESSAWTRGHEGKAKCKDSISRELSRRGINLPTSPGMSATEQERVIRTVVSVTERLQRKSSHAEQRETLQRKMAS